MPFKTLTVSRETLLILTLSRFHVKHALGESSRKPADKHGRLYDYLFGLALSAVHSPSISRMTMPARPVMPPNRGLTLGKRMRQMP